MNESPNLLQRWNFVKEKLCCVYDEIAEILFILSFWTAIRLSMQIYTFNSCNVYMKSYKKNLACQLENVMLFYETARITQEKY